MKKFYYAFFAFAALSFASCSTTNYSHSAEDDVYFSSQSEETIEVNAPSQSEEGYNGTNSRTYPIGRTTPNNRQTRRSNRTNDPNYCPPSSPRGRSAGQTRTPRASTPSPSTRPSTPAPSRQSRPSRGGRPM